MSSETQKAVKVDSLWLLHQKCQCDWYFFSLLFQVQSKYDEVRMTSLESASVAQKLLQHPRKNSNPQTISSLLGRQKITGTSTMDANPKSSRSVQKAASMKLTSDSSVDLFKTSKNPERTMEDFKKLVDSRI